MKLLYDVEIRTNKLSNITNLDSYLKPISSIQNNFIRLGFSSAWKDMKNGLSTHIHSLDIRADAIERDKTDSFVRSFELQQFLEKFESLLADVNSSDLEETAKGFLQSKLNKICESIRDNSFSEPEKISQDIKITIGEIVINSTCIPKEEIDKPIFQEVISWMLKFGSLLALGSNTERWLVPHITSVIHLLSSNS